MRTELASEHSLFVGEVLQVFLYGIQCYMFVQSTYLFLNRPRITHPLLRTFYVAFGAMLLAAMTLTVVSTLVVGSFMWIDHRDVPGGPPAYYAGHTSSWFETSSTAASSFADISGEILLIYRSYIIWGNRMWVLILLGPLCLTNIAMSTISLIQSAIPGDGSLRSLSTSFPSVRGAITVTGHISATILISARLMMMRHQARSMMNSQSARIYTSVIAIFVESALPYSVVGIACLTASAVDTPIAPVFIRLFSAFCCLTPQLIILRIAMGLGWNSNTETELMTTGPPIFARRVVSSPQTDSVLSSVGEICLDVVKVKHVGRESESALQDEGGRDTVAVQ